MAVCLGRPATDFLSRASARLGRNLALAALVAASTVAPALAQSPLPERRVVLQADTDLPGGDLNPIFETTQQACVALCLADQNCTALTYNARSRACFPKSGAGAAQPFVGAISGQVISTDAAMIREAEARVASAKDWLRNADDLDAARAQAEELGTLYPGDGQDISTLREHVSTSSGDLTARVRWQGAVTSATDSAADWNALSAAMVDLAASNSDDRATLQAAQTAALNAWLRSSGPATESVIRWATISEKLDRGIDGLRALHYAQAHGGAGDPQLAEMLPALQERHGFRVTDSQVDSDTPDPRACVSFSGDLAPGVDFRPFVALPDPAMAVEAEGSQLCVSGLTRGATLALTLRNGLPAADGQTLARAVDVKLYVRDRAPMARFGGRAYVLPAASDQGLTLYTVNANSVDLTLFRMSDRNIVRAIRDEIFAAPLDEWGGENFTTYMGEQVWEGTADVAPATGGGAHPVNAEVATRLDLLKAGGPLEPGIYAMRAQVQGASAEVSPPATQWFMISDLGLATYSGTDGLTVAVRGLSDAAAKAGIEVTLVSRGNAVLATGKTDDQGIARFEAGLTRGAGAAEPAIVTAATRQGDEITGIAFLSLIDPEFDLSDRGVEGNPPAPPVDIFVATDRGAYRAGETAYATLMTRDDKGRAIDGLPLTALVMRPDGVEHARLMAAPAGAGGYTLSVPIPDTAPRGQWRVDFRVEADGPTLASAKLLVEDFRPERIDFDLTLPETPKPAADPIVADIDARWLFGAPAAGLPVDGEVRLTSTRSLPGWDKFEFGRADRESSSEVVNMPTGTTDDAGHFTARIDMTSKAAQADVPYEAQLILTVREGAGRPVERRATQLIQPGRGTVGIRPTFDGDTVPQGGEAQFEVVSLGPDLKPRAGQAEWVLNRIETEYQWYSLGGDWNWEPITRRTREGNGSLTLTDGPASVSTTVDWGEYELLVTAADGTQSSTRFWAGWGAASTGTDTPDKLTVALDKPNYKIGDTAQVTVDAVADGVAVVSVLTNRVVALQTTQVKQGRNTVDLPVTEDWGANAYVAVSAIRPVAAGTGELSARAPIRALGIAAAAIDPGDRALQATLTAPAQVDPRGEAKVTLAVAGAEGRTINATVWAVDQGILNLTSYQPPSASDHYLGQRRLGVGLRDLYGRLIMPGGAADGAIRAGGDAASMESQAAPPTEKLMAWFSGPVTLGADGTASVAIPLPDFNGELRVMALVWDDKGVGQTDTTILVRDPVVMTATVPAFLSPGDIANAQIALTHVDGPAGDVALSVENIAQATELAGNAAPVEQGAAEGPATTNIATEGLPPSVTLAEKQAVTVPLTLTAPDIEGLATLRVSAKLPDGRTVTKDLTIPVQRSDATVNRKIRVTLPPGSSQTVDLSPLGAFRPGTGRITMTSGALAQLDVPGAVARLVTYPYGCTEQLSSGALPQLYAGGLMPEGIPMPPSVEPKSVDNAIAQILTRQTSDGNFGLWRAEGGDRWLTAYVADFLGRARSAGHAVPDEAFQSALRALQNGLNSAADPQYADETENTATAYAAYVLAREGQAVISDLRYYVDTAGDSFHSPMAAAQLGAALAAYGDQPRADLMFRRAQALSDNRQGSDKLYRSDYGTLMRDRAGLLTLAAEAGSQAIDRTAIARDLATEVDEREAKGYSMSTQEAGWIVLAAQSLSSNAGTGLTLGGAALSAGVQDLGDAAALPPVELANTSAEPIDVMIGATAVPVDPQPAGGTAFTIRRSYFTAEGQPVDPALVPLGTRMVVLLEVFPARETDGRLIVADPLPAGFEIDNPNLLSQGEVGDLDWLGDTADADMAEFRQDRFAAAVTAYGTDPVRLAYRVRAVTPGAYHHPAATVEDMYRADRRAWTDSGTTAIIR